MIHRITISLPLGLFELLKKRVEVTHRSISGEITQLIEEALVVDSEFNFKVLRCLRDLLEEQEGPLLEQTDKDAPAV